MFWSLEYFTFLNKKSNLFQFRRNESFDSEYFINPALPLVIKTLEWGEQGNVLGSNNIIFFFCFNFFIEEHKM